jgi:hypothetical protein
MSHHAPEPDRELSASLQRLLSSTADFRGAIGAYPDGKLAASDEGSIQFAVGGKDGKVVIDFGTPVAWLGMTPQQAADLASTILSKAREVGRQNGEMIHVRIG